MSKTHSPLLIGAHTSAAGGVHNALLEGQMIGANIIQLFTSNQKQWKGHKISDTEVALWEKTLVKTGISHVMSHAGYLINLGSPNTYILENSRRALQEEVERCHQLKIPYLNFHPGAATGSSEEECLNTIIDSLLSMEKLIAQGDTKLIIESTAGQGSVVGYLFEHLHYIIDKVHKKIPIGVCIDTCHTFAAGYDISTLAGWESTLKEFDKVVGLKYLQAFHMNDSEGDLGSRKDRHASLGKGQIGIKCFEFLVTNPIVRPLPKYLETPDPDIWPDEIALLRKLGHES